jgi:hypothetical protein
LRSEYPDVGLFAQALYPLVVASSDDFGRQKGDAFSGKYAVWATAPDDEKTFDRALEALRAVQLIQRYEVDGETYMQIVDFDQHQQGLHKRTRSSFPEPPGITEAAPEIPSELKRTEQKGIEKKVAVKQREIRGTERRRPRGGELKAQGTPEDRGRFARFWAVYPKTEGESAAWEQWLLTGPPGDAFTDLIVAAAEQYAKTEACQRARASGDLSFVSLAKNWLADGRWDATRATAAPTPVRGCPHTPRCTGDPVACTDRKRRDMRKPNDEPATSLALKLGIA